MESLNLIIAYGVSFIEFVKYNGVMITHPSRPDCWAVHAHHCSIVEIL
jgi:hypothetical protein